MSMAAVGILLYRVVLMGEMLSTIAVTIYGVGLVGMFGLSAAYNLMVDPNRKEALRRYDHAAIYVMIAGAYTPFALIGIGGTVGYGLLALVWLGATIGAFVKFFWSRRFERASVALYLVVGWASLPAAGVLIATLPTWTLARGSADVFDNLLRGCLTRRRFLPHLHSSAVTMSQKSSYLQITLSVQ